MHSLPLVILITKVLFNIYRSTRLQTKFKRLLIALNKKHSDKRELTKINSYALHSINR
ncbi:hypothetical protein PPAR_a2526 [Pseudoalteromonas paragorgicola KMM 3548]|nr:hypothetical protein [Pseudoalteromonas distincta KMM 3548]